MCESLNEHNRVFKTLHAVNERIEFSITDSKKQELIDNTGVLKLILRGQFDPRSNAVRPSL